MKKYNLIKWCLILFAFPFLWSCDDLLDVHVRGTTEVSEFFSSSEAAEQVVTAAYAPLGWEYDKTFYSEWFIGDVVSDDAIKGGQNLGDMAVVYEMENFRTQSNNGYLEDYYKAQFIGIYRANFVLDQVSHMDESKINNPQLNKRILAEARFLRAFYFHRLVRVFGGVPKIDFVIKSQFEWGQPRASKEEIYELIYDDLINAIPDLPERSEYADKDLGRVTKGAARALLMKAYLNNHEYAKAKAMGQAIIDSKEYTLCENYWDNFTLAGENGPESVFEIQYVQHDHSAYPPEFNTGNGYTVGTFTVKLVRTRANLTAGNGWGFNHPSQELYDTYEFGDPRRDMTIINPSDDEITNPAEEYYLGNKFLNRKYALMDENYKYLTLDAVHPRGPLNKKEIRYADVLLMYAEACCETGDSGNAKWALEEVRSRARSIVNGLVLPSFPYGSYADNKDDLRKAIRHERRVELAMEGHRWFDLVRWGVAAETMNAYRQNASPAIKEHMSEFVAGKHELFPLPLAEIEMNPMAQNPGY